MADHSNKVSVSDAPDVSGGPAGKYGKPRRYDPDFKGPIKSRSCTDIICLILFILYFIGMIAVAIIGILSGDPRRLVYPTDSNGTICGIDEPDKPYLVFFDLTKCSATTLSCDTPQVCVVTCPDKYFFHLPGFDPADLNLTEADIGQTICINGVDPDVEEFDLDKAVKENKCAPYVLNSTDVFNRCLPAFVFDRSINEGFINATIGILVEVLDDNTDVVNREDIQSAIDFAFDLGGGALVIIEDIQSSWHIILIGVCIGTVLCFIWCFIMRYIAGPMVWGSILVLNCLLAVATALCYYEYRAISDDDTTVEQDFEFTLNVDYYLRLEKTWLIAGCICGGLFLILLLLTCCLCNRIRIAIALIEEASRSVTAYWSTLFWPLLPFLLEIFVIALWCVIALYLGSAREDSYTLNDLADLAPINASDVQTIVCGQGSSLTEFDISPDITDAFCTFNSTYTVSFRYLQAYNLFGFLWLLNFIIGFSHLTLAGVFSKYYWTFDKKNKSTTAILSSLWVAVRYHLGTIAFGAAIIAIIQFIRILLEYLEVQLKKGKDNPIIGYTLKCLKCLFWCLEKFMKFINKNAYIMVAIYGKGFCTSAKKAFFLLMRNIIRVAVVNKITDFLLFLGALMVTTLVVLISFFFYAFGQDYAITAFVSDSVLRVPDVRYYWIIIILIGIGTFVVAKLFFGVFDMAVDTLFLCFLEDLERNDGSAEKPYFMNKKLQGICGKKNKHSKEEEW